MKIELIGALDYNALKQLLEEKVKEGENVDELVELVRQMEISRRTQIVGAAGRLSRFPGTVLDSLGVSEENDLDKNIRFVKRVIGMGHDSITDHDYCVFEIQDVSTVIEQIIIAERFCSFTIKSRREVDFSNVGYYVP
jgi:thymidylate synthase ThyX